MLKIQPMTEEELLNFKAWLIEDYAGAISINTHLPMDEARLSSIKDIEQGLASPTQLLYNIVLYTEGEQSHLGSLWIDVDSQRKRCFINEIVLYPEFRGQGWGQKTLELLETMLKAQGISRISLNVFTNNSIAQALYRKMGYEVTNMRMQKILGD